MLFHISPESQFLLSLRDLKEVKGFTVAHINIRSIMSKIDFLPHVGFAHRCSMYYRDVVMPPYSRLNDNYSRIYDGKT